MRVYAIFTELVNWRSCRSLPRGGLFRRFPASRLLEPPRNAAASIPCNPPLTPDCVVKAGIPSIRGLTKARSRLELPPLLGRMTAGLATYLFKADLHRLLEKGHANTQYTCIPLSAQTGIIVPVCYLA